MEIEMLFVFFELNIYDLDMKWINRKIEGWKIFVFGIYININKLRKCC